MANHAYVKTKLKLDVDKINILLNDLNKTNFKNVLTIDFGKKEKFWNIFYKEQYVRQCWIQAPKTFELRHGAGGVFQWWVAELILNTVAYHFDGNISDDGVGGKWKPDIQKYQCITGLFN